MIRIDLEFPHNNLAFIWKKKDMLSGIMTIALTVSIEDSGQEGVQEKEESLLGRPISHLEERCSGLQRMGQWKERSEEGHER